MSFMFATSMYWDFTPPLYRSHNDCYWNCSIGHRGDFGHEYLQFELLPNGLLRYTNNSMYKKDGEIHKEAYISASIMDEFRKMIVDSDIMNADDEVWPRPDELGKQELEIVMNNEHISLATRKIGTSNEVSRTKDPEGLMNFYFLTQDLKAFVLSLIRLHFKIKPLWGWIDPFKKHQ